MNAVAERYLAVRRQIADAADVGGRSPDDVTLVAVTKTVGVPEIELALAAGIRDLGENRAHDFVSKQAMFPDAHWHFIGTLQSNKARQVVGRAHLIHSIDSLRLLQVVDRHARDAGVVQPVLLQVNVSEEETKHGMTFEQVERCLHAAEDLANVSIRGLMTMAPLTRPESVRWVFRECAEWLERLRAAHIGDAELVELSMGMTNDFGVAVEEGATIVRVGRALFGR